MEDVKSDEVKSVNINSRKEIIVKKWMDLYTKIMTKKRKGREKTGRVGQNEDIKSN